MNTDDHIIDANGSWSSPQEALEWYRAQLAGAREELRAMQPGAAPPDAYLVVQISGYIVGGWQERAVAEHVAAIAPARDNERVVPVRYLEKPR